MNIKDLCIKNNSTTNEPKVAYIDASGDKVVTAGDIQVDADLEILNRKFERSGSKVGDGASDHKRQRLRWI